MPRRGAVDETMVSPARARSCTAKAEMAWPEPTASAGLQLAALQQAPQQDATSRPAKARSESDPIADGGRILRQTAFRRFQNSEKPFRTSLTEMR